MEKGDFTFGKCVESNGLIVKVPKDIQSKRELLEGLGNSLKFPDYYGVNWDAFDECINDLSWLPDRDVVIRHLDLPLDGNDSLARTYLLVLMDAIARWKSESRHHLTVIFPAELEPKIQALIASREATPLNRTP